MLKDEERFFNEIRSGRKARCELCNSDGLRCTVPITGVKWHYIEINKGAWCKSMVLYTTEPHNGFSVSISDVTGIDVLRENEFAAAYAITYADGKRLEVITDKPREPKKTKGKKNRRNEYQ